MRPLSTMRLSLLRACYAVLVVGLSLRYGPVFFEGLPGLPRMDGVVVALLSAMGILAVAGLFSPVRMLPLLVFEIGWKLIWVSAVALPKWLDGSLDEATLLHSLQLCRGAALRLHRAVAVRDQQLSRHP